MYFSPCVLRARFQWDFTKEGSYRRVTDLASHTTVSNHMELKNTLIKSADKAADFYQD